MHRADLDFQQQEVAELACVCERYCGTQSGGMDQAISIMGQRGLAKARLQHAAALPLPELTLPI
jgi:N-acetylgalactosamine kinase